MKQRISTFFLCFFISLFSAFRVYAESSLHILKADTNHLRVGIAGSAPFVITGNNYPQGISIEIWQLVSAQAGWHFTIKSFNSVPQALAALDSNQVDVVVGPVSITSQRAKNIRFSQPYFQSSLSIMSRAEARGIWNRIAPFFSTRLLIAVLIFISILACVGTLLWMAEREKSPTQFPSDPAHGIADGMWLAIVTMSTTGYGDKAPITFWGRIIASAWMIISLLFATTMVAGIASTLTLSGMGKKGITKASGLADKKVAVLLNSPSNTFAQQHHAQIIPIKSMEDGYRKLKNKEADALVFDRPQLLYFLQQHPDKKVMISPAEYYKQGYGFATPLNTQLAHKINIHLLTLSEEGRIDRIVREWLGTSDENE